MSFSNKPGKRQRGSSRSAVQSSASAASATRSSARTRSSAAAQLADGHVQLSAAAKEMAELRYTPTISSLLAIFAETNRSRPCAHCTRSEHAAKILRRQPHADRAQGHRLWPLPHPVAGSRWLRRVHRSSSHSSHHASFTLGHFRVQCTLQSKLQTLQ